MNNANGKTSTTIAKTTMSNGENVTVAGAVYGNGTGTGDGPDSSSEFSAVNGCAATSSSAGDTVASGCNLGNTSDPLVNGNDSNNNDSNGNTLCQNLNNVHMNGNAGTAVNNNNNNNNNNVKVSSEITAVRRSARAKRGDKKIEMNVSSSMVLLDIKKKVRGVV